MVEDNSAYGLGFRVTVMVYWCLIRLGCVTWDRGLRFWVSGFMVSGLRFEVESFKVQG